jgi:hypothetical protein
MCIITAARHGKNRSLCLTKTRDRAYNPRLTLCYTEHRGVAILMYLDLETTWVEGINEHGLTVVNSALMVKRDEKEHKKGKGTGKTSQDSQTMMSLLSCRDLDEALEMSRVNPLRGHTLITDGRELVHTEYTSRSPYLEESLDTEGIHAYTNHGILIPKEGYPPTTDDGISSRRRSQNALKALNMRQGEPSDFLKLLPALRLQPGTKHPHDMIRDTEKMRTSTQAIFCPDSRTLHLQLIEGKVDFRQDVYVQSERATRLLRHEVSTWRG